MKASSIPLFWVCLLSPVLRLVPQTRLWSPMPWNYGPMFGLASPIAAAVLLAIGIYAGTAGMKAMIRLANVTLPLQLLTLIIGLALLFTRGIAPEFLPLLAFVTVTSDFTLLSTGVVGLLRLFGKNKEKVEKHLDKPAPG